MRNVWRKLLCWIGRHDWQDEIWGTRHGARAGRWEVMPKPTRYGPNHADAVRKADERGKALAAEMSEKVEWCVWGALFRSRNKLDGKRQHLCSAGGLPILFCTRREARTWINDYYGYIRDRQDLRREPHGWQMPKAVRVTVSAAREARGEGDE